ncbi:MAG: aspartate-semialdehyde dehydrogenase [candidate division NC10 bacterium]|nr:aspartate-semialdehyde dehydrogenase [candidate division NC10 bacterium]
MAGQGYAVAVVGATGAVGETLLQILDERKFPVRTLRLFASERSAGRRLHFQEEELPVEPLAADAFRGVEVAFFSAGAGRSKEFAPAAARAGAIVIDNSSAFRMDPEVPLVVPEINPEAAFRHKGIIANPNCTAIVMLMPLKPLHDHARVRRVVATSYQAVSGAGAKAIEELKRQVTAWVKGEPLTTEVFPHQIAFNVLPQVDAFLEDGYTREEMKLVNEMRKILGDEHIQVSPTTVRVPVFRAHAVAVNVETERPVSVATARQLFAAFPGLRVLDDPSRLEYPMPLTVAGTDDCYVGRIRQDLFRENGLNFWAVGDQLRKGAALNAVQIAELLIR